MARIVSRLGRFRQGALAYSCNSPSLSSWLAVAFAPPTAQTGGLPNECVVPVDLMTFTAE